MFDQLGCSAAMAGGALGHCQYGLGIASTNRLLLRVSGSRNGPCTGIKHQGAASWFLGYCTDTDRTVVMEKKPLFRSVPEGTGHTLHGWEGGVSWGSLR